MKKPLIEWLQQILNVWYGIIRDHTLNAKFNQKMEDTFHLKKWKVSFFVVRKWLNIFSSYNGSPWESIGLYEMWQMWKELPTANTDHTLVGGSCESVWSMMQWAFQLRIIDNFAWHCQSASYPAQPPHIHNQAKGRGVLGLKTYIEERAVEVAKFMIHTNATVRETAKKFGISKSTVHKDITARVERIDPELAKSVRQVLEVNKAERHIRGGLATREKYLHNRTKW